ncbi:MAG: hypothetical protein ABFD69_01960 [Candidatus Sumerlaeia bacterium]
MKSRTIRWACVLACALWLGAACSRAHHADKTDKAEAAEAREGGQIENAVDGTMKPSAARSNKVPAVRRQPMPRSQYEKRLQTRQKYLERRRQWIMEHQDQFRAIPE